MPDTCGCMIITLQDNGTSRPIPVVTFDPVGRFTAALINDHVVYFAQEIERAQAKVRANEQASLSFVERVTSASNKEFV